MDSIVRQGIKQHKDKDVFAPRFSINLLATLKNGLDCSEEDKVRAFLQRDLTIPKFSPKLSVSLTCGERTASSRPLQSIRFFSIAKASDWVCLSIHVA